MSNKYQAVYIEWIDSTIKSQVWHTPSDLLNETKEVVSNFQTIAFLVNENKHEYILASSIHFDAGEAIQFGQVFTIPKGCVLKMQKIKILVKK